MGLVANCFRYQFYGSAEGSAHALLPGSWNSDHQWLKQIAPDGASAVLQTQANPPGHYLPAVWNAPILVGDMSMRTDSAGDLAATLVPTRPMAVDMTGVGDLTATAALAVAMAVALAGSGDLEAALQGRLNASVDMTGAGDLAATISGLGSMAVDMVGSGDLDAVIAAYGNMALDVVVTGTGLTVENVAGAVWNAGIPGAYAAGSAGKLLGDLLAAGAIDGQDLAGALRVILAAFAGETSGFAAGGGVRVITAADGSKVRLTVTQDANGNRTLVVVDGSP